MRLLENSTTRSVFNVINEELRDGKEVIVVKTGLSASDKKAKEILNSVIGQMSDGIWENSPGYSRYWKNIDIGEEDGEIVIYGGISYGSPFLDYRSSTGVKDDSAVRKFMAHKIKQIVKIEADDGNSDIVWKRDCETPLSYMGYDETITVRDCYRVYDKLLGRIDRITEGSIPSMHDENFADYVLRDFRLFLMDRYGDELYRDVTEDDVNDYFTGMFFEMMDYDDLDSANAAEDIIRTEYHISDKSDDYQEYDDGDTNWAAEEESDALDRFENRYMSGGNGANFNESVRKTSNKHKVRESVEEHDLSKDLFGDEAANRMNQKEKELERDLQYVRDIMAGKTVIDDKYHEELSLDTAKAWLRKDFVYVNSLSAYSPDEINKRLADEYPDIFSVNESVKPKKKAKKEKKPEERVIMRQGNVTCLKKDNKFKVFEDADTNLAEYDSQEEAMRDALNRCGVNPDNELSEEKDDLKESTQYQVIKTVNVGPSNYQSEVHGTYDSYEQAEDICSELNAQGIGATIKEVNEVDEALKKLLLKKEELYNDDTISDEDYYSQIEIIDNILVNNYSIKDIEEAEKELGINS